MCFLSLAVSCTVYIQYMIHYILHSLHCYTTKLKFNSQNSHTHPHTNLPYLLQCTYCTTPVTYVLSYLAKVHKRRILVTKVVNLGLLETLLCFII